MTNISDLHLFRVVINGKGTNALKRYETGQYELDSIFIESREDTESEWHLDQVGQQRFRNEAAKVKPRTPKERKAAQPKTSAPKDAFRESIRHLAAVCRALAPREDLTQKELEYLWDAITGCGAYTEKALTEMAAARSK